MTSTFDASLATGPAVAALPEDVSKPRGAKAPSKLHLPALDGLRGLAIALVLFYHFTLLNTRTPIDKAIQSFYTFTWTGVDLFFVLSGFLITGILYDAKSDEHYFRNFYARRTVRIFPLYYAFLIVFFFVLPLFGKDFYSRFGHLNGSRSTWPYWLYLSNFVKIFRDGIDCEPLGITWSLAIEEQFYLLWPMVVLLCSRKQLKWICGGMMLFAIATRIFLISRHGYVETTTNTQYFETIYNLTPCRMEPLAIGAFVALTMRGPGIEGLGRLAKKMMLVAPLLLLACILLNAQLNTSHQMGETGRLRWGPVMLMFGFTCFALMYGTMLVLTISAAPTTLLSKVLRHPVMRMFGRYSYAIYLFNQPIKIIMRDYGFDPTKLPTFHGSGIPGLLVFYVVCTSLTVAAAWLSWNLLEKHFLKLKDYFPMRDRGVAGGIEGGDHR